MNQTHAEPIALHPTSDLDALKKRVDSLEKQLRRTELALLIEHIEHSPVGRLSSSLIESVLNQVMQGQHVILQPTQDSEGNLFLRIEALPSVARTAVEPEDLAASPPTASTGVIRVEEVYAIMCRVRQLLRETGSHGEGMVARPLRFGELPWASLLVSEQEAWSTAVREFVSRTRKDDR